MRFSDLWPALQPYIEQHPWLAPVLAAGFPLAAVLRGISLVLSSYHDGQRIDRERDEFQYRGIMEQRDSAQAALAAERERANALENRLREMEQAKHDSD